MPAFGTEQREFNSAGLWGRCIFPDGEELWETTR